MAIARTVKLDSSAAERTVGAALRGRPAWNSISANRLCHPERNSTPGGHGGPPLQFGEQFVRCPSSCMGLTKWALSVVLAGRIYRKQYPAWALPQALAALR